MKHGDAEKDSNMLKGSWLVWERVILYIDMEIVVYKFLLEVLISKHNVFLDLVTIFLLTTPSQW